MINSIFRNIAFIICLTFSTISCVGAEATIELIDQAIDKTNHKNFQQAYDILKPLADKGDAYAIYGLGNLYGLNIGNNPYYDTKKELATYAISAKAGNAYGQFGYASALKGQVAYRDSPELYDKNYAEACIWYEKAAKQSLGFSQVATAWCYENGAFNGKQDYIKAYMWFSLAADRFKDDDDPYAPNSMASVLMQQTAKKGKLSKIQINKALKMAQQIDQESIANSSFKSSKLTFHNVQ